MYINKEEIANIADIDLAGMWLYLIQRCFYNFIRYFTTVNSTTGGQKIDYRVIDLWTVD